MGVTGKLQFGDNKNGTYSNTYNLIDSHLHFMRHHNHFKPDTDAKCDKVEVVVVAPGKEDLNLYEWYISNGTQNGRLTYELQSAKTGATETKILLFEGAYCYSIEEEYQINTNQKRFLRLSFVAEKITINDVNFNNLYANTAI